MAGKVRDQMIEGAMTLLARRGLQATSFSEVLAATGAPRGSLYHHFPGGKDQLVAAALEQAQAVLLGALDAVAGQTAEAVTQRFLAIWRAVLTRSQCETGCAVLAVTVAADSDDLMGRASAVLRNWQERLAELLLQGGMAPAQARAFATVLIASAEGAVALARAERSMVPFETVAEQLLEHLRCKAA